MLYAVGSWELSGIDEVSSQARAGPGQNRGHMEDRAEVLVIGGGPGGATVSLLLVRWAGRSSCWSRSGSPVRKVCGGYLSATSLPLLDAIGIGDRFRDLAGPEVRQVGLFAASSRVVTDLPRPSACGNQWGRALSREHLDEVLLRTASSEGVDVRQPWVVEGLERQGDEYLCRARAVETPEGRDIRAAIVIAAHGSWDPGTLPTQPERIRGRPGDLIGFSAHYRDADLPAGLMPLLAFKGGYGGMAHCDDGRVSLSCCIRRDCLEGIPRGPGRGAGESVLDHILEWCPAVRPVLDRARARRALAVGGAHPAGDPAVPPRSPVPARQRRGRGASRGRRRDQHGDAIRLAARGLPRALRGARGAAPAISR